MIKKLSQGFWQFIRIYRSEISIAFKDEGLLIFLVFLPLAYPVIYSLIYNTELVRDVRIVVVDHDRTAASRELYRNLDATQDIWCTGYAADLGEARRAMDAHHCYGIIEIPEGFGRNLGRHETANAVLYSDMSLLLRYRGFIVATTNVMQAMGAELQTQTLDEIPMGGAFDMRDPMPVSSITMGNIEDGFASFIMPGMLILILQQCIILVFGMRGGARHEPARLVGYDPIDHGRSIPVSMLAQMAAYFTILLPPILFLAHYVPLIFAFPMAGSTLQEMIFLLPVVLSSMALGLCVQSVVTEREAIFVVWVVTSLIFLFLSGLTWPRYAMPELWQAVGAAVPATWGVEGFIRMNTNGASLAQVHIAYRNLWILTGVYFLLAWCLQKWVVRPAERAVRPY